MRSPLKTALFLPFLLAPGAQAQIYLCKDADGRTISSDRMIPECANRALREFDKSGRPRREIPPPLSAEQKRQLQIDAERRKAEESAAEEQRRNDRLLRTRYKSEADIEESRKRALAVSEDQLRNEKNAAAAAEKQRQVAQAEAEALKKRNAPVYPALQQRLDETDQALAASGKSIGEIEAEMAQINAKHDAALKRFRELNGEILAK